MDANLFCRGANGALNPLKAPRRCAWEKTMQSEGSWLSVLGIDAPRKEELSLQLGLTKSLLRPSELLKVASTFYLHEFWWGVLFQPIVITALDAFANEWITPALLPHCFASSRLVITCSRSKSWEQGALKLQPSDWPPSDSNAKSPNAAAPINLMAHDTSTNEYTWTTLDSCCPADSW